jgi:hypothetical protein
MKIKHRGERRERRERRERDGEGGEREKREYQWYKEVIWSFATAWPPIGSGIPLLGLISHSSLLQPYLPHSLH